ncbi:STAS domain-containing protein [Sporosarcina sp. PTS2304]|uniref:STAS domain-containing protein n=1 Tax=Sporosarcina sp. PTS2304 TaxID=2283194 RepID=UPI000E0D7DEA|nr:STAS domain-containing protein [Sporosarcina sp. PTS2304]AXH98789.1 STAS domain-containing protein [Sporosarcina sp. PTS2304]
MKRIDLELYEYLVSKFPEITEVWLAMRRVEEGSIYSLTASEKMEQKLREQNRLTILTITSSLLEDPKLFEKNKKEWAEVVALSRVNSNTPIEDVLEALSNVRLTYWRFLKGFYVTNEERITIKDYVRWSETINSAFDQIYVDFAETYNKFMSTKLTAQQTLINELSSPVIKLTPTIGVMPLIGDMDDVRARVMLQSIPEKCLETDIIHLFIDLSGVSVIDTLVAQQIFRLTQVLSLLGTKCTITGIRPEIAHASTELGLDFTTIETFSSLQQAFSKEFKVIAN